MDNGISHERAAIAQYPERSPEISARVLDRDGTWYELLETHENIEQRAAAMRAFYDEKYLPAIDRQTQLKLGTLDAYTAEVEAVRAHFGVPEAERRDRELCIRVASFGEEALPLRATTPRGLLAKCRAALDPDDWEDLGERVCKVVGDPDDWLTPKDRLLWSLWCDLQRLEREGTS